MTTQEFSNEFDTLVNSYSRYKDFDDKENLDSIEFNEYEKSIYLTQGQEQIIKELYNGKNSYLDSFEKTEEIRRYLSNLLKTEIITLPVQTTGALSPNSVFYTIPAEVWYIVYEQVKFDDETLDCLNGSTGGIVPVTLDEYYRVSRNPFRGPSKNRVLRLSLIHI